jgi:hypothetical protein
LRFGERWVAHALDRVLGTKAWLGGAQAQRGAIDCTTGIGLKSINGQMGEKSLEGPPGTAEAEACHTTAARVSTSRSLRGQSALATLFGRSPASSFPPWIQVMAAFAILCVSECGPPIVGKPYVRDVPPTVRNSPSRYECVGMNFVLVENSQGLQAWAVPAKTCNPHPETPFVLTHHVRDERADHFLTWTGSAPDFATELVVPLDRNLDATLMHYEAPQVRTRIERGRVVGLDGKPRKSWTCWVNPRQP